MRSGLRSDLLAAEWREVAELLRTSMHAPWFTSTAAVDAITLHRPEFVRLALTRAEQAHTR